MIDYVPNELWKRDTIKVLDPCAENGNFGAYCMLKTSIDNIWFNEINKIRHLIFVITPQLYDSIYL